MSEKLVNEMVTYHKSLCEQVSNENEKYSMMNEQINFDTALTEMEKYLQKLRHLQKDMIDLSDKSKNLHKRAEHLGMLRKQEDERLANELDRVKKMEQSLKPVKPGNL